MKYLPIPLILLLTACGQSATPSTTANAPSPTESQVSTAPGLNTDVPPPGSRYSLLCAVFEADTHIFDAQSARDQLIQQTGLKAWHILNTADKSYLYYGYYSTISPTDDRAQAAEYTRAQDDRQKIGNLKDSSGVNYFQSVLFQPIETPDPPSNKEWDITQAPGYWTLWVLTYKDTPDRKEDAVEAVRSLRAQGIEAWYHHGEVVSDVFIGHWPANAVKQQESTDAHTLTRDPSEHLVVANCTLPAGLHITSPDGKPVRVVAPKVEILDPTLQAAATEFPDYSINGNRVLRVVRAPDGSESKVPLTSYLMPIPHDTAAADAGVLDPDATQQPTTTDPNAVPSLGPTQGPDDNAIIAH